MGQQQLLLIVLGVIIVGIAVVVGINLFNANAEASAKDTVSSEATNLGAMCLQYFKKPLALGGGGNSFVGFVTPPLLATTTSGSYVVTPNAAVSCKIVGTPTASAGYNWTVTVTVTAAGVYTTVIG